MAKRLKHSPLGTALGQALERPTKATAQRTSFAVAPEVAERLRDAAFWERRSVVSLVEQAILELVERLEEERGETFKPRPKR